MSEASRDTVTATYSCIVTKRTQPKETIEYIIGELFKNSPAFSRLMACDTDWIFVVCLNFKSEDNAPEGPVGFINATVPKFSDQGMVLPVKDIAAAEKILRVMIANDAIVSPDEPVDGDDVRSYLSVTETFLEAVLSPQTFRTGQDVVAKHIGGRALVDFSPTRKEGTPSKLVVIADAFGSGTCFEPVIILNIEDVYPQEDTSKAADLFPAAHLYRSLSRNSAPSTFSLSSILARTK